MFITSVSEWTLIVYRSVASYLVDQRVYPSAGKCHCNKSYVFRQLKLQDEVVADVAFTHDDVWMSVIEVSRSRPLYTHAVFK